MSANIIPSTNQPLTMSSRELSTYTSKQHQHVKRDIEKMISELNLDASKIGRIYKDSMNREKTEYILDRDLTDCLLLGYSAPARLAVIKRWKELEQASANPPEKEITETLSFKQEALRAKAYIDAGAITKHDVMTSLFGSDKPVTTKHATLPSAEPKLSEPDFILDYMDRKTPQTLEQLLRNIKRCKDNPFIKYRARGMARWKTEEVIRCLLDDGKVVCVRGKYALPK